MAIAFLKLCKVVKLLQKHSFVFLACFEVVFNPFAYLASWYSSLRQCYVDGDYTADGGPNFDTCRNVDSTTNCEA